MLTVGSAAWICSSGPLLLELVHWFWDDLHSPLLHSEACTLDGLLLDSTAADVASLDTKQDVLDIHKPGRGIGTNKILPIGAASGMALAWERQMRLHTNCQASCTLRTPRWTTIGERRLWYTPKKV